MSLGVKLSNTYFALRHGRSTANEQGIIVSDPDHGIPDYGLSDEGWRETRERLAPGKMEHRFFEEDTICFSSDFRRAMETAEVFCDQNGLGLYLLSSHLRERNFGELELDSHDRYQEIWDQDLRSDSHNHLGAESPVQVRERLSGFLEEVEGRYSSSNIVVVAHGDILQILQTIFAGIACNEHRSLPHLGNAELRKLNQGGSHLSRFSGDG